MKQLTEEQISRYKKLAKKKRLLKIVVMNGTYVK